MKNITRNIAWVLGSIMVMYGYYLLWAPVDTEFSELVFRAKTGMFSVIIGAMLLALYAIKR